MGPFCVNRTKLKLIFMTYNIEQAWSIFLIAGRFKKLLDLRATLKNKNSKSNLYMENC